MSNEIHVPSQIEIENQPEQLDVAGLMEKITTENANRLSGLSDEAKSEFEAASDNMMQENLAVYAIMRGILNAVGDRGAQRKQEADIENPPGRMAKFGQEVLLAFTSPAGNHMRDIRYGYRAEGLPYPRDDDYALMPELKRSLGEGKASEISIDVDIAGNYIEDLLVHAGIAESEKSTYAHEVMRSIHAKAFGMDNEDTEKTYLDKTVPGSELFYSFHSAAQAGEDFMNDYLKALDVTKAESAASVAAHQ